MLLILLSGGIAFGLSALFKQLFLDSGKSEATAPVNQNPDGRTPTTEGETKPVPSVLAAISISVVSVLLATLFMYAGAVWYYGEDLYFRPTGALGLVGFLIYRWLRGSTGFWGKN
jgi:hypothetical protein